MKTNELYFSRYDEFKKLSWYSRNFKQKISKSDVFELIEKSNDSTLKQTVNYIYNLQGDLLPYDLIIMRDELNKMLEKHYDSRIKNLASPLNEQEIEAKQQSIKSIQNLIDKYYPKPNTDE